MTTSTKIKKFEEKIGCRILIKMRKERKKRKIGKQRSIEWNMVNSLLIESCKNNQNQVQMNDTCRVYHRLTDEKHKKHFAFQFTT